MNYQEETLNIDTPENVAFGYNIAGIGSRFLAALLDTLCISFIQLLVLLPVLFFLGYKTVTENLTTWVAALLSLLAFVFFWGYYIFFELIWNGQSPGKRLVGLRVVRRDGTPVTLFEVLIRNLLRVIDLLPSGYGVGLVTMFIDSKSRRLGDMAAGTLVVHDRGPVSLDTLAPAAQFTPEIVSGAALPQDFPIERLTGQDMQLVEDYLQRREGLENRALLAGQILKKLCQRAGLNFESFSESPDEILAAIASAALRNKSERERK